MRPPDINFSLSFEETTYANNTSNITENENGTAFDIFAEQLATSLNLFYTPFLILLGTIGNLVSIFVFYKSKLRFQSTSQYLSALAFSDTIFLMQLTAPWLNALNISGLFHEEIFCQVFVYISYACCCMSSWLVVAFTVERFVAVLYPLRRNMLCTVTRARSVIIAIAVCSFVLNIPILKFAKPSRTDCNIDVDYLEPAGRFNLIDTGITFSAPLAVIIMLNVGIMYGVCRVERARLKLLKNDEENNDKPVSALAYHNSQNRVTRMLLVVSTVYIALNFPAYSMRLVAYVDTMADYSRRWIALQQIALMFFNTNYGINFILYCLIGQNFRRALCQTIPCLKRHSVGDVTVRRATTFTSHRVNSLSASFVSNVTEATNSTVPVTTATSRMRQRQFCDGGSVITQWKFDNSRQLRRPASQQEEESIEMGMSSTTTEIYSNII